MYSELFASFTAAEGQTPTLRNPTLSSFIIQKMLVCFAQFPIIIFEFSTMKTEQWLSCIMFNDVYHRLWKLYFLFDYHNLQRVLTDSSI